MQTEGTAPQRPLTSQEGSSGKAGRGVSARPRQAVPAAQESWEALRRARSGGEEERRGRVCPGPGELLGPPAPRVASRHPLGVSSLSSQGQQRLQLYSLGRLEPGREAPPRLGTWHRVPGTRGASVCISGCPHQEPQRQSLCSPLAPAGQAPQLWASKPPQLFLRHVPPCSSFLRSRSAAAQTSPGSGLPSAAG